MSFVQCLGLVKIFSVGGSDVLALQGLDLEVRAGEMIAVIGSSGSGKSTLLNILGGLDTPTAGICRVDGWNLQQLSGSNRARYLREVVGFVWQHSARNLIPYLSALQNVELPILLSGGTKAEARERASELLSLVGLHERNSHMLTQLSGGEQQRVAIALALANRPRLLLADEPTGSVDTQTASSIMGLLRTFNQRHGTTIMIVTHDRSLAEAVDRYVLIRDGKVASEASSDHRHEEWVVIDRVGRLQIPLEVLEQVGIKTRARLELTPEHILLRRP